MIDFEGLIKQYPLTYKKFLLFNEGWMQEPPKSVDDLRELLYAFIKRMGFRVYIDFNYLSREEKVIIELYSAGNFISGYEKFYDQNEIYYNIFEDAFEEMETWYQVVQKKMSEEESNKKVLQE